MTRPIDFLKEKIPADCLTEDPAILAPRLHDWYHQFEGQACALARPRTAQEVALILSIANETGMPIVIQGGNTGLSGGAIPDRSGQSLILSLERMNRIRVISAEDNMMIAEAGCILADLQEAAGSIDRLFPLSLSTEGSSQIGGNLATNAGGINVLRYGMARDLTLGLEVILADGRILSDLRPLRKNNSGYDWKQIFIGSEGTLGIITAACLKLFPLPKVKSTAFAALRSLEDAPALLHLCQEMLEQQLVSFELIPQLGLDLSRTTLPTQNRSEYYVLAEARGQADVFLEGAFARALEMGLISDAVLAQNEKEARQLWQIREKMVEAQKAASFVIRHDIAVSVAQVPAFISRATELVQATDPKIVCLAFGHLGDGNIHFNLLTHAPDPGLHRLIQNLLHEMGGTFSAEHGIGQARLEEMRNYKSGEELHLMRQMKELLDPHYILNPGKVIPLPGG